ncbi:receptor-like protein EIX1 [Salvia hispanica]|uniref:receptor-like protein EIX1 n=1 Tax=Salvia hispanica TaxID=49212 RepID=UPI002009D5A2|nr:receptor-like protein EIX1 [Salvia hispanica]
MISNLRIDIKYVLVVLSLVFVSGDAQVRCIKSERETLLRFKDGLIDDHEILSSWQSDECCEWHSVDCSNTTGHVITLRLNNVGYADGQLQEILDLSFNQLNGSMSDLRGFPSLIKLDLRGNSVTSSIPLNIGQLSKLQGLVTESLFSKLDKLKSLDLSFNSLILDVASDWIPPFELNKINLAWCKLSGNKLSGSISSICKTPHDDLQHFDLSNNQLAGEVPNCWDKMPSLNYLNLANNNFSGEIPLSFGNLQELVALQMHGNGFSGELPYSLRLCQYLVIIDIGGNKLTGEIPTWIGQLSRMRVLNFRGNKLHGSIPLEICSLTYIQVLDLSINSLSSIIPDCFNNFTILGSKLFDRTYNSGYW